MKWCTSRQGICSCTSTTGSLLAVFGPRGPLWSSYPLHCTLRTEKPTAALRRGAAQLMEEQRTENEAVAINIFMGGLLCKAEGKYDSSRINIFNKKCARRRGFC